MQMFYRQVVVGENLRKGLINDHNLLLVISFYRNLRDAAEAIKHSISCVYIEREYNLLLSLVAEIVTLSLSLLLLL